MARQHHVQDHRVVGVLRGVPETLVAVESDVDGEAIALEARA